MKSENRKYIRFKAQDKLYAALGTHFSKIGKLRDISIGGLAFEYIENTKSSEKSSKPNSSIVSIFHSKDSIFLSHLACTLIYDHPMCTMVTKLSSKKKYVVKRCGLQFTAVTGTQRRKLELLLGNYTYELKQLSIGKNFSL